jgi:hypothetical protein
MNKILRIFTSTLLLLPISFNLEGQIKEITFGEIPKEDLVMAEYKADLSADAVILDNYVRVTMRSDDKIIVKVDRHIRIKIINTDGLDYANVELPYGNDEKIIGLRAASYNIEEGVTVRNDVDKKSFYQEKTSRYRNTMRFSVPNVRVGSVIEYKYSLESHDYFTLYTLEFQHEIPVRASGFRVEIPGYFEYKFIPGGDLSSIKFNKTEQKINFGSNFVEGYIGQWNAYNVPAYREEPFSTGSVDYNAHIGFELSKINVPGVYFKDISPTYANLSKNLLEESDFVTYFKNRAAIRNRVLEIKALKGSETELLKRIYTFVSDYMMWNGYSGYMASASMNKIYKDARGNAADINLMLLAMLREAGLNADPVIFSTREHGLINPLFAIIQKFNYVAVVAQADGEKYILDATDPVRPFNMLPLECLNGNGWIITQSGGSWINVRNNEQSYEDMRFDMVLDESGTLTGTAHNTYESYDAWAVRKVCRLEGEESYADIMRFINNNWRISHLELEGLKELEQPVIEKISLTVPYASDVNGEIMYLNPVIYDRSESNEFYEEERLTPVDLGCPSLKKYSCMITIPEGWTLVELPQSVNLRLEGGGAEFRYDISAEGRKITLETEIKFTAISFEPERYKTIRDFWTSIIRKQAEVVILKKEI